MFIKQLKEIEKEKENFFYDIYAWLMVLEVITHKWARDERSKVIYHTFNYSPLVIHKQTDFDNYEICAMKWQYPIITF